MTIETLKRVMQKIRVNYPGREWITWNQLEKVIMVCCGTCRATYFNNKRALTKLGWISKRKRRCYITGLDITEDFNYE